MQSNDNPSLLPVPFAENGTKNVIPIDSQIGIEDGRASYNDGFPPLTMTPVSSGGVPPYGADFNGVLNAITACLRWNNAGMSYGFDSTFATKIQGYPKGAVVANSDNSGFWINTEEQNVSDPESGLNTQWLPAFNSGIATVALSSSPVTLTPLQAAKDRIILTGAITANINLTFPLWPKHWTITNNCTGNFSVICGGATGTSVAVANGKTAEIYCDGANFTLFNLSAMDVNAIPDYTSSPITGAAFDLYSLKDVSKRGLYSIPNDSSATAAGHFPVVGNYGAGYCLAYPAPYGNTLTYVTWQGRTFINTVGGNGNYYGWKEQGNANNSPINYDKSYSATNPGSDPDFNTAPLNGRFFVYADAQNGPGFRCNIVSSEILPGYATQIAYANSLTQPVAMALRIIDNGVFGAWVPIGNNSLGNSTAAGTNTVQLIAKSDCTGVIINCVFHYNGVPPTPGTFIKTATATVTVDGVSIGTATNSLSTNYGNINFSQSFQDDGVLIHQFNSAIASGSTVLVDVQVQGYLTSSDIQLTLI